MVGNGHILSPIGMHVGMFCHAVVLSALFYPLVCFFWPLKVCCALSHCSVQFIVFCLGRFVAYGHNVGLSSLFYQKQLWEVCCMFNKIAISNNKFQMASGQGSHWLIESPTIFSSMCSPPLSDICQFYF